ncbi:MAG TPA: ABC transporter substrate-binding protein, partial [Acidimicrobiales bacterium]|nr:ABC transporter substrate-binding protein [Acidimicrobiales bacterium]
MSKKTICAAAAAASLVALSACSSASTHSSTGSGASSSGGTAASGGGASSSGGGIAAGAPISFGETLPETGPAALYAPMAAGVSAYFQYVNAQGGVNGHQLKITSLDDQYQPPVSVQLTRQLVDQDHIFAEVASNGSAAVKADLTVLTPANIPLIGPATGADFLYPNRPIKNVFSVWPAYHIDGQTLANYAVKTLHLNKIGVFYQNDDFGKSLLNGFESTGAKPAVSIPYTPTQSDFG